MKIQELGSGCKRCKELYDRTQKAVQAAGIDASLEYITNIQKIIEMGLMSSPVLVINGEPVIVGGLPDVEKIKELIKVKV
jgi:small redox-active disulfide protein 2